MQTKATSEQARSPVPGVIPEPVSIQRDRTDPIQTRRPRRRSSRARARLLSALHGDKYLVGTDPQSWAPATTAPPHRRHAQ